MKIVFFGLTITSSWGNGHATTYRSLLRALAQRGHSVTFIEKDVEWYRSNRDLPSSDFCKVAFYEDWAVSHKALLKTCSGADAIVIGSYFPDAVTATRELLDAGCHPLLFYDIDTPVTISHLRRQGRTEYLDAELISFYDAYLSFTGGPMLREIETCFGARRAVPLYCSVDPARHKPAPANPGYRCLLSYLGTYAPDRQSSLMELLNQPATAMPDSRFLVAGPQYPGGIRWAGNVERIVHLSPPLHPQFYCSSQFTLNLTRDAMRAAGYSPSVRLFEASACGAAILSDPWPGIEEFLTPGEEILLARSQSDALSILRNYSRDDARRIGRRARARILAEHTSAHRATQFEEIVNNCRTAISREPGAKAALSAVT